jgi:hypothetical protein
VKITPRGGQSHWYEVPEGGHLEVELAVGRYQVEGHFNRGDSLPCDTEIVGVSEQATAEASIVCVML